MSKLSDCKHGTIVRMGDNCYRVYRLEEFAEGTLGTMKRFARLIECEKRNPSTGLPSMYWYEKHDSAGIIRDWSNTCEVIDDSNTAVAGEKLTIRI